MKQHEQLEKEKERNIGPGRWAQRHYQDFGQISGEFQRSWMDGWNTQCMARWLMS